MTKKSTKSEAASKTKKSGVPETGAQGVRAGGADHADAAHLGTVNNALVNHHYLEEKEFQTVAETLQRNLATTISLYLKFKKYHWDIRGRFFRDLHLAYDEFIAEIFPSIDEQAERLVALGGSPLAAPADLARYSNLAKNDVASAQRLEAVQAAQASAAAAVREAEAGVATAVANRAVLDDQAALHHRHVGAQVTDHGQVVADEEEGHALLVAQVGHQVQDLGLHRHIERTHRFVGDDELGTRDQRAGDGDALALAT